MLSSSQRFLQKDVIRIFLRSTNTVPVSPGRGHSVEKYSLYLYGKEGLLLQLQKPLWNARNSPTVSYPTSRIHNASIRSSPVRTHLCTRLHSSVTSIRPELTLCFQQTEIPHKSKHQETLHHHASEWLPALHLLWFFSSMCTTLDQFVNCRTG